MYRIFRCMWCGVVRRVGDDHLLWCPERPRDAIQEGKSHG